MSVTDPVCGLEFDESLAIVHEHNDKKYADKLIENFLLSEKALSEKKPVQDKVTQQTCVLK